MIQCHQLRVQIVDKVLLDNIDVSLQSGKIHAFLGANGAGKSTLLKCMSKDLSPSSGEVIWQGKSLKALSFQSLAQNRAVLLQQVHLNFGFRVSQVIQLGLAVKTPQKQPGLVEIARLFDLETLLEQNYLTLSGGEQQRTQLARVFAQLGQATQENLTGKWLLLDEWTTGLDLQHLQSIRQVIRHYVDLGLGVIMVVHDLNLANQMADECHLLKEGRLCFSGKTSEVLTTAHIEVVYGVKTQRHQTQHNAWFQVL